MSVFVVASVSGAPGATTTALGLAQQWGRQVLLVDADPVGGAAILAGHYQGRVANPGTLVELWVAQRQGRLAEVVSESALRMGEFLDFIPGPAGAAQAASLMGLWPALAVELKRLDSVGVDVIVDYGRLGHARSAVPVLRMADQVLIVVRSDLVSVAGAAAMESDLTEAPVGLIVIRNGVYSPAVIAKALGRRVEVELPWVPQEATALISGDPTGRRGLLRRPGQVLARRLRTAAEGLQWRAEKRLEELDV